jgi:DNA-binding response OmpR family regulator
LAEDVGSTVMIVGVDSDFTYLMQYYARKSGRQALVSSPDDDALILAKQEKPALIVLEADRADAAGWELLQTLRADEGTGHIPVLVCSWLDEGASGLADGASSYLQKPVLYGDFLNALAGIGQRGELGGGGEEQVALG